MLNRVAPPCLALKHFSRTSPSNEELERPRHGATRALDAMHTCDARGALPLQPSRPAPSEG